MGNQIFDGTKAIRLLGVDRPGSEYSCVQGPNIFDPADGSGNDSATVTAMKTWGINAVRIPLNEDCWLSLNGVSSQSSGAAYQSAIKTWVGALIQGGIYPILDLHWTENAGAKATGQQPMPDAAHGVAFWTSVATAFASQPQVVFDLFNEPYPDMNMEATAAWQCWKSGGTCPGVAYSVAGMQQMLTAVRSAGANNLVLLAGIEFANDLSQWLAYVPTDPANNLGVSWHVYNNSNYTSNHSFAADAGPVVAKYPVVATEIGDIMGPCDGAYIGTIMGYLDVPAQGVPAQSYLAWSWSTDNTPSILGSYAGTPACDGTAFKAHVLAQPQ
jgi:hypothetical protein